MENHVEHLTLSKGNSSYSSFFKSQVSFSRDENGVEENEKADSENDKADKILRKNIAENMNGASSFDNEDNKQDPENEKLPMKQKKTPGNVHQGDDAVHPSKTFDTYDPEYADVYKEIGRYDEPKDIETSDGDDLKVQAVPDTQVADTRVNGQMEDDLFNNEISEKTKLTNNPAHVSKYKDGESQDTPIRGSPKQGTEEQLTSDDKRPPHIKLVTPYSEQRVGSEEPNIGYPIQSPEKRRALQDEISLESTNTAPLQDIIQISTANVDTKTATKNEKSEDHSTETSGNVNDKEIYSIETTQRAADTNEPNKLSPKGIEGIADSNKHTENKLIDENTLNGKAKKGDDEEENTKQPSTVDDKDIDQMPSSDIVLNDSEIFQKTETSIEDSQIIQIIDNVNGGKSKREEEIPPTTIYGDNIANHKVKGLSENNEVDQMPDTDTVNVRGVVILGERDKTDETHADSVITQEEDNPHAIRDIDKMNENIQYVEKEKPSKENDITNTTKLAENADKKDTKGGEENRSVSGDKSWAITLETSKENSDTGDTDAEILHKQPQTITEDASKSKSNTVITYDNIYFTGKLPSLPSRHDSLHSSTTDLKTDRKKMFDVETEQVLKQEISDPSRKSNENYADDIKNKSKNMRSVCDDNTADREEVSKDRKPPTPSRKIREIIQEINEPKTNKFQLSRERPLTPKRTLRPSKSATASFRAVKTDDSDAIEEVQKENEPVMDDKGESLNMTINDITSVTSNVLSTVHAEDNRSKFDELPHMKHISNYVHNNLNEREISFETGKTNKITVEHSESTDVNNDTDTVEACQQTEKNTSIDKGGSYVCDTLPRQTKRSSPHYSHKEGRRNNYFESPKEFNDEISRLDPSKSQSLQRNSDQSESKQVQRSSTENDLKAIIASAKMAISNGTETTESQGGFETSNTSDFTLQGDNISLARRKTLSRSLASQKGVWSTPTLGDQQEALASLICSNCLQVDSNVHSAGYCTNCQQYLCRTCITVHNVDKETRQHEIVPSYCKNELAINKYIPATGYCVDCSMFLCMKCVVQHTGFRANRHHRIIQSTFVSKPRDKKTEADNFLDEVEDKIHLNDSKASSKGNRERKKKRKLLVDLDNSNPYSFAFSHVPDSLYPGPKNAIASSYTKNPKWVHSSIPNLPYLVQPKQIPDKAFHAAGHAKPRMIYTKPKAGFNAMDVKLKVLKSRYKIKDDAKTHRRKEQEAFTARPVKARDNLTLPDIQSVKSHTSGGRSLKHTVSHDKSERKEVEYLSEQCLSIPFPRGEKRTDILSMTVLLNGKLVVLDRNNNNIKVYSKRFNCTAALQFQNRLVDICASNLCETDVYAATPKHLYEIPVEKDMRLSKKVKVEIKRIEGMVCWKYGLAIISKKTYITWELRLLDYRGNLKSKLEIFNPFTLEIGSSPIQHMTSSRGGKFISLADMKNSCIITVDVTTRVVVHETMLEEGKCPTYLTSDGDGNHNLFVACDNKVFQISRKGKVLGALIDKTKENGDVGCIVYNKLNDRLYVQTGKDTISVYQIYF